MITTAPRPFRFAVTASHTGDLDTWIHTAKRIEGLGYTGLLLPDIVDGPAPLPALSAAAAATTALQVGTWVINAPLRPPGLLTWEARTLHHLLRGRFELGLGAGRPGSERDAETVGTGYGPPGQRIAHLVETLQRLRNDLPDLRVLVAGSKPRMLRLAAHLADTVALGLAVGADSEQARDLVSVIARHAEGRRQQPELAAGLVAVNDAAAPWLTQVGTTTRMLAASGALSVLTGTPRAMADELRRRRDAVGITYWTVPEAAAETFAPVIALASG